MVSKQLSFVPALYKIFDEPWSGFMAGSRDFSLPFIPCLHPKNQEAIQRWFAGSFGQSCLEVWNGPFFHCIMYARFMARGMGNPVTNRNAMTCRSLPWHLGEHPWLVHLPFGRFILANQIVGISLIQLEIVGNIPYSTGGYPLLAVDQLLLTTSYGSSIIYEPSMNHYQPAN